MPLSVSCHLIAICMVQLFTMPLKMIVPDNYVNQNTLMNADESIDMLKFCNKNVLIPIKLFRK